MSFIIISRIDKLTSKPMPKNMTINYITGSKPNAKKKISAYFSLLRLNHYWLCLLMVKSFFESIFPFSSPKSIFRMSKSFLSEPLRNGSIQTLLKSAEPFW